MITDKVFSPNNSAYRAYIIIAPAFLLIDAITGLAIGELFMRDVSDDDF